MQRKHARWYSRFNPIPPFAVAFFLTCAIVLGQTTGGTGWVTATRVKIPLSDALTSFPLVLATTFAVAFVGFIIAGRRLWHPPAIQTVICTRCRRTQTDLGADACECGGRVEPIEYWYWSDDDVILPNT